MSLTNWLPLVDYSNKYRVSISTLRRRIKLESIPFKLNGGKYYIIDESPEFVEEPTSHQSTQSVNSFKAPPKAQANQRKNFSDESMTTDREERMTNQGASFPRSSENEPVFSAANRLLDELKKAYTLILQEKDEQIRNLREEITDLKTLVRVLEGENNRLSRHLGEVRPD